MASYVNLAGTTNSQSNAPYNAGTPFFYILMDNAQDSTNGYQTTIDVQNTHIKGILSKIEDGPQAETSVLLPQDNE